LINQIRVRKERVGRIKDHSEVLTLDLWKVLMSLSELGKIEDRKRYV